jgi:hypothetical protein
MKKVVILIVFCFFALFACGTEKEEKGQGGTGTPPSPIVTESSNQVVLSPEKPTKDSILSLALNTLSASTVEIEWLINNQLIYGEKGLSLTYPPLKKGDVVQVKVTHEGQEYYSNKVTIHNSPPEILSAQFSPDNPKKDDVITMKIKGRDIDGDDVHYLYKWYVNGKHVSSEESLNGHYERGDKIDVHIVASDSEEESKLTYKFRSTIYNSPPVISDSLEGESFDDNVYKVRVKAYDPDGDNLTFSIKESIKNLEISPDGQITWKTGTEDAGDHTFTVILSDGHGGDVALPVNVKIGFRKPAQTTKH